MTSTSGTETTVVGSLRALDDSVGVIRIDDVYDTDIHDLWSALTDPARLARWLATVSGELRQGGAIHATFTSSWDGPGRIDVCQPPHRLQLTMEPGTATETVMEALLTPEGARTRLVIEDRGLPLTEFADHGAGWQVHLEDLRSYLAGAECGDWKARWLTLLPAYRALPVVRAD